MAPGAALPARVVSIRGRGRSASASAGMRRLARLALGRASPRALPRSLVSAASANDRPASSYSGAGSGPTGSDPRAPRPPAPRDGANGARFAAGRSSRAAGPAAAPERMTAAAAPTRSRSAAPSASRGAGAPQIPRPAPADASGPSLELWGPEEPTPPPPNDRGAIPPPPPAPKRRGAGSDPRAANDTNPPPPDAAAYSGESLTGEISRVTFHNADNAWTVARVRVASFDVASLPIGASAAPNAGRPKYKRRKPKKPPAKSSVNGGGSKAETIITVVGHIPGAAEGRNLRMRGDWRDVEKWGMQFQLRALPEEVPPADDEAMRRYLAGGALPGVGVATAEKIVGHFGSETFDAFDAEDAEARLAECPGIGAKTAAKLKRAWDETRGRRDATAFLQAHGLAPALAQRAAARHGAATERAVRADPFGALAGVRGATFHRCDALAARLGKRPDDPARLGAAMLQVLASEAKNEGHVYVPWRALEDGVARIVGPRLFKTLQDEALEDAAEALLGRGDIVRVAIGGNNPEVVVGKEEPEPRTGSSWSSSGVFARSLHDAEAFVAADVANRLSRAKREPDVPRVRRWLQAAAQKEGWRLLSPAQEAFLDLALREPISVLTGGPGTGKTFATHIAVRLWRAMGRKVLMCAPTGRAAQRLAEIATAGRRMSQPVQSSTIHRLLETRRGAGAADGDPDGDDPDGAADGGRLTYEGLFARDASSPLDADVVVVDESSMLDLPLCAALLDAVKPDAQLVFVGDADQLPSVGPGSVLRDLLNSGAVPAVQLREVFRQAEQSGIVRAAHAINAGRVPDVPVKAWDPKTHRLRDDAAMAKRSGEDPSSASGTFASSSASGTSFASSSSRTTKKGWSEADCVLVTLPDDSPAGYESALESLLFGGALPALAGLDPTVDLQVLTPFRRGPASTTQLNAFLQARLNPPGRGRLETRVGDLTLREGDRVLQQRNDYAKEVFNGDLGTVVAVDGDGSVRVVFGGGAGTSGAGSSAGANESTRGENDDDVNDAGADSADAGAADSSRRLTDTVAMASRSLRHGAREVSYSKSELRDLIPAWALTVHKAQGSEYRAVVLCLAESHRPLLRRELAYTAASRAKEVLVILAPGPALELAVRALGNNRRCTTLARRLEPLAPDAPSCPAEAAIAAAADEKKRRTKPPSDDRDDAEAIRR